MKKRLIPAALCALAAACTSSGALYESGNPPAVRMAASEIVRNPSPTNLDGIPAGKVKWNYTTGLELLAIADAGRMYGIEEFTAYAERYFDTIVRPGGEVLTYKKTKYNLDHVCPGARPFSNCTTARATCAIRWRSTRSTPSCRSSPAMPTGGFWHKKVYPHQMWLDGLYMAQPFYAEYAARNLSGAGYEKAVDDIVNQFVVVAAHTYDPATGLYRHAYDDSREMFWCDKTTGQSAHAWGRAMGWYAMAIVETLQYLGVDDATQPMVEILNHIYEVLPKYADPATGMWYQVLDQPGREGNYLESTASAMFVYAMLKGVRLGYLPAELGGEARRLYEKVRRLFREGESRRHDLADRLLFGGGLGRQADAQRHVRILHLRAGDRQRLQGRGALYLGLAGDSSCAGDSLIRGHTILFFPEKSSCRRRIFCPIFLFRGLAGPFGAV